MSSIRFHCAICGAGLSVAPESAGRIIECPACRHVVPVPAPLSSTPGAIGSLPLLPRGILALEVKFLCPDCNVKLQIDARLEGQTVNCPKCQHEIRVPHWSTAPVTRKHQQPATPTAELSEAEIEFLSGPTEMKATHAATA